MTSIAESALRAVAGPQAGMRAWCLTHCKHDRPVVDGRLRQHVAQAALELLARGQLRPSEELLRLVTGGVTGWP